jgi:protein-disulfide isomerase
VQSDSRWSNVLTAAVAIAVVVLVGWKLLLGREPAKPPLPLPAEPLAIADAQVIGSPDAKVVMIEFSEFQCPFCGRYARELGVSIYEEFVQSGVIRVAFRNLPLESIHPQARPAALANQRTLGEVVSGGTLAGSLGLTAPAYEACLASDRPALRLQEDKAKAEMLGITGTPTFLIGYALPDGRVQVTTRFSGTPPASTYRQAFQEAAQAADRLK